MANDEEADSSLTERMCIVTRAVLDESALLRFVRGPDGSVVPDLVRKLPGRGVWVSLDRAVLAEAVRKKLFSRGFGAEARADAGLPDLVARLLRQACLSYMSLAKKAGDGITGFMKVEELLGRGRARILLHAREAQPDGCRKLDKLMAPGVERIALFSLDELDLAFGRSNVVHAAVAKGGLAEKLLAAVQRMEIYDAQPGATISDERA